MTKKSLTTIFVTLFLTMLFTQPLSAAAIDDFVIQVKTDNAGSSSDTQFTIPTVAGIAYYYAVDCDNNGSSEARGVTGDYTCNYAIPGIYTIRIHHNNVTGNGFPRIYFNNTGDKLKIVSLDQWGTGHWTNMRQAFFGAENMLTPALDAPDLTLVQDLTNMFAYATLANPDTSGWNTSSVTLMYHMFGFATNANPDTSNWNTSLVTNMGYLFYNAISANPDTSNWDTSSVHFMHGMFRGAIVANPDTSNWDTTNVSWMQELFDGATLANPNTSNWDVSSATSMGAMFRDARSANPDTSNWNTSSVMHMQYMFTNAVVANPDTSNWDTSSVKFMPWMFQGALMATPDTSGWNTSNVTNMNSMFLNAVVANPNTNGWNTSKVTSMKNMFFNATSANPNTSGWDTSQVIDMSGLFINAPIATPDTSNWNTSNVTSMSSMFNRATVANPDTSGWDTSKVESMDHMFWRASAANPDTSNWNTALVTDMKSMFAETTSANPDTSNWNTEKVTDMNGMFAYTLSAVPNTTNWNTSLVTNMSSMFNRAALANPNTSGWNTSKVESMDGMFLLAPLANPDTSNWNTSLVTDMRSMFHLAVSANPDTSNWDVSNVGAMHSMFFGVTLPTIDYEAMLIGFNNQTLQNNINFHGGFSQYCSFAAQSARANMIATDNWDITDGGLCAPAQAPDLTSSSDSGISQLDDLTNDNTPDFNLECTFVGNTLILYSNFPVINTIIGSHICLNTGSTIVTVTTPLVVGLQNITYTERTNGELQSEHSAFLRIAIDTVEPSTPNCLTTPNPVNNGTSVTTTCDSVEVGSALTIDNMTCPAPTDATGIVACTGTVGTSAGQITIADDTVTVTDTAGNSNTDASTGLEIDNLPPTTPICSTIPSPAKNGTAVITTCSSVEEGSSLTIANMSCPAPTDATGNVACTGTVGTSAGQITIANDTVTVTDTAGNSNTDASTGLEIDNTAPIGPGSLTAPENLTNDINDDIVGSCGSDATNGKVVVTSLPINGFSHMYGISIDLDNQGTFTIVNPNWSEGIYELYFDCEDEAGNGPSMFGSFGPIEIDLTVDVPVINPIATTYLTITGTAEPFAALNFSQATCTNAPVLVEENGDWSCLLSAGLDEGVIVTVVATDLAGNVSADAISTVLAVNVAPSFDVYCDIDATDVTGDINGSIQFPDFIYNMLVGPANESAQTYELFLDPVLNGDPDSIIDSMELSNSGELTLNINVNNSGVATLEVSMVDSGGIQVGGVDTTTIQFNVHNYADLNLDPRYSHLDLNELVYKNTFGSCR